MGRIGILCFAASYGAAWVLEVCRLWVRSGWRGWVLVVFAAVGLAVHSVFLGYRAATVSGSPLSSEMDWCLLAAWVLAAVYLVLLFSYPRTPFGLVLLPLALGLIGAAGWWASPQPYPQPAASRIWGLIHAAAILLATVAVLVAFTAGVLYLVQAYRLKQRWGPMEAFWLPSLEWLERLNSRALSVAVGTLAVGVFGGVVLNWINYQQHVPPLPWSDPLVMTTLAMLWWLLVALGLAIWYHPADQARKVAFITLVSFIFLLIALAALLLMDTSHGRTRNPWTNQTGQTPLDVWREVFSGGLTGSGVNRPVRGLEKTGSLPVSLRNLPSISHLEKFFPGKGTLQPNGVGLCFTSLPWREMEGGRGNRAKEEALFVPLTRPAFGWPASPTEHWYLHKSVKLTKRAGN